jgi:hypothetical protein
MRRVPISSAALTTILILAVAVFTLLVTLAIKIA